MPRKGHISKREPLRDPVYTSTLVNKFINSMMWDGKKSTAQGIFYESMEKLQAKGGDEAIKAARLLSGVGYENVLVVTGGLTAWKAAGLKVETGTPTVKVAYAPKPRAGSIPVDEFIKLASNTPSDVLVLDVRSAEEAKYGMIKGAVLVPDEEILARLPEIPRDKLIITHCSSGVRAEMAYHKLKERGYRVAFLNAEIDIGKDGRFNVVTN